MSDESYTYTVCPYCGKRVEPDAREVVYAVEQVDAPGLGQAHDLMDGRGGYFHPSCSPEDVGYVRRERPDL